nr:STAS domain-containing protein [Nonomuraea typhae]
MRGADIAISRMDTHTVVVVIGEMDLVSKALLIEQVDKVLGQGAQLVIINLSGVTFLDAQGLSALVISRVHAAILQRRMMLTEVPAAVRRLLEITNLDDSFAWTT